MKQLIKKCVTTIAFLVIGMNANAAIIGFDPADQDVQLGDQVSVNVTVGDLTWEEIGAYDLFMGFDDDKLSFDSVIMGDGLDVFGFGANLIDIVTGAGMVNVAEVSFDSPEDLEMFQDKELVLFTLVFDTLAAGLANVWLDDDQSMLVESFYYPVGFTSGMANINILDAGGTGPGDVSQVPEANSTSLFISALVLMVVLYRQRELEN